MKSRIHPRFRWPGLPTGFSIPPSSVTNSDTTIFFTRPPSLCTRLLRLFQRTDERVPTGGEPQLPPGIGEVGVGWDPGHVRAVRISLGLQEIKLRRGADLITVPGQAGGVLAGLHLRARRFAGRNVGLRGVPARADRAS